jgi:hypothetical protein
VVGLQLHHILGLDIPVRFAAKNLLDLFQLNRIHNSTQHRPFSEANNRSYSHKIRQPEPEDSLPCFPSGFLTTYFMPSSPHMRATCPTHITVLLVILQSDKDAHQEVNHYAFSLASCYCIPSGPM